MAQALKEKADSLGISYRTAKQWRANGANLDNPSAVAEYNANVPAKRYRVVD
jgi:predicted site-specific integrase-resolvase